MRPPRVDPIRVAIVVLAGAAALALLGPLAVPPQAPDGWRDATASWWLAGARYSVLAWLGATSAALVVGTLLGMGAAIGPRALGLALSRAVELAGAAPTVVIAAVVVERASERPVLAFVGVVALLRSIDVACVIRERASEIATLDFVLAARATGAGRLRIARRHVLPHVAGAAAASALLTGPMLFALEAALVYLGMSKPLTTSWTLPLAAPEVASARAIIVALASIATLTSASYVLSRALDRASAIRGASDIGNRAARD